MKKSVFIIGIAISLTLFTSCNFWREADYVIKRNRTHLDLEKPTKEVVRTNEEVNYQNKWYILKNDADFTFNSGDTITFNLKGTPEQNLPAISAYLIEYKDPQFTSKSQKEELSKSTDYKKKTSEYVVISDEQKLFDSAEANVQFDVKNTFTVNCASVDNTQIFWLLYVNEKDLPENYFDYYEKQLEEAKELASEDAKTKADRRNQKEKLTEEDEKYHKPEDFEENCYKKRVNDLGEKRIIINDVELRIEIINQK